MRITNSVVLVGAGRVGIRGEDLAAYRDSIVDPIRGPALRAIVDWCVAALEPYSPLIEWLAT
ncbi:MAG: hypothetical protein ABI658_25215 [Acidimicrobiales bacterium]